MRTNPRNPVGSVGSVARPLHPVHGLQAQDDTSALYHRGVYVPPILRNLFTISPYMQGPLRRVLLSIPIHL